MKSEMRGAKELMKNWIIYDIEIEKAIPSKSDLHTDGIAYCEGWHDHKGMGISVVGVYDYVHDRYRVFCRDNADELAALIERAERVIGFNNLSFDDKVLEANWGIVVPKSKTYDLLVEIWIAAGLEATFNYRTHGGFGLDAMAAVNLGEQKTGHGSIAPVEWQRGNLGNVIDYCLMDVRLTKRLIDLATENQWLLNPRNKGVLQIRPPYLLKTGVL